MRKHQEVLNRLHQVLDSYKQITGYYDYLDEIMKPKFYPKTEILYEQGETARNAYFLSSGFMTANHYTENGDKQVISIFSENEIVSGKSFTEHTPSDYELVAYKDSYVLYLSYEEVNTIYGKFPETQEQAMIILASREQKELEYKRILGQEITEQVLAFYQRFSQLLAPGKIIRDRDIASYLLIGQSTLRAVRTQLLKTGQLRFASPAAF